ncbi:MAG: SPOR domain-containing protein [Alphaproteobacteria bacterium]|nr:SPOR domain-containing protein [Alphaproteobacteria bacterium]OJV44949.1 MAG: hypothetical protein BGO28_06000 [Alphaproteobacteria bacterium 43-37]
MSLHYSAAWGQTLRSASLRRQKSKPFVQEPIPTFFHGREEPAFQTSNPEPVSQQHGIEQDLYAKSYAISSDSNFQKRFSKEFMRAITVQEREEIDTVPVVPRYRHAQMQEAGEYNSIVPNTQQGFILNMNKLSLISLIFGLLLLGLLFFVGGFMLAINFFGDEAPQSPPVHQQAHHGQNPLAGQLIQHTPVGKYAPIASDVARIVPAPAAAAPAPAAAAPAPAAAAPAPAAAAPAPAAAAPAPAAAAPAPAAAAPALAPVGAAKKADNYGYAASPQVLQASAQVSAQGGGAVIDASELTRPYALQVGIYTQRQGAQQIVNTLQRRGYHAYVVAVQMQGQDEVYAVRMGGYFTQAAASNAAQHLTQKERFKVMAVARNNAERVIF